MMKNNNLPVKLILIFIVGIIQFACLIEEVEQPTTIEAGTTFTSVLNIAAIAEEVTNPHHGVIGVLHPIGWEFESGTFESTDSETPSGNIILDPDSGRKWICTEAEFLADSGCTDIDTLIGIHDRMEWTYLLSDVGDYYDADAYHEVTLNFNTDNGLNGTYPIGYITTVNTWGMDDWLNTAENTDNPNMTDTSMNHMVEVTGSTTADIFYNSLPVIFELKQNYPNPFNSNTSIQYFLPSKSNLSLSIHRIDGTLIKKQIINNHPSGSHTFRFNASDIASGVYLFSLVAGNKKKHIKMLHIK
ncbi:MAG: hypothetical protein CMG74_12175 [Candidatus Marinimicrobia bacterium]|nr:hypothetical protein [Candidatus Neomarinimicrobiota bacterium]|tara:strand:- start:25208 stop:26110 length:903 start_codon:yes stop_codon:yes gene_type:complete